MAPPSTDEPRRWPAPGFKAPATPSASSSTGSVGFGLQRVTWSVGHSTCHVPCLGRATRLAPRTVVGFAAGPRGGRKRPMRWRTRWTRWRTPRTRCWTHWRPRTCPMGLPRFGLGVLDRRWPWGGGAVADHWSHGKGPTARTAARTTAAGRRRRNPSRPGRGGRPAVATALSLPRPGPSAAIPVPAQRRPGRWPGADRRPGRSVRGAHRRLWPTVPRRTSPSAGVLGAT